MRRLAALIGFLVAVWFCDPIAHADIGGTVPSPGECPYPATGAFGAAGGEYDYACQFPVEINGSRHTTLFGGGMWFITGTVGFSFLMFNASLSAQAPAGVLRGITYFACPDFSMAADPNPPGAWKDEIHPPPCKPLAPRPVLIRPGDQPPPPPGIPPPPAPPAPVSTGPAVTNPDNPNPEATQNQVK
jgi:hypothetical protein